MALPQRLGRRAFEAPSKLARERNEPLGCAPLVGSGQELRPRRDEHALQSVVEELVLLEQLSRMRESSSRNSRSTSGSSGS